MVIDAWQLYEKIMNKDKCKNCFREVNHKMKTKDGCIWCDVKYHNSKKIIALKKLEEIKNG